MAVDNLSLPKDAASMCRIMDTHALRSESSLMARRTVWLLAWYYLNGYRRFDVFDPSSGRITPHFLDEEGNMEYQSQDLLYAINQVCGRIQSMDVRPKIETQAYSLGAIRNRAIGQTILDSLISEQQAKAVNEQFAWLFTCLGSCGITGHIVDHPTIGLTGDIEVVHPKEIFPFPVLNDDPTKVRGMMRQRWVPVSYLKDIYGRKVTSNLDSIEYVSIEANEAWDEHDKLTPGITYWGNRTTPNSSGQATKDTVDVAKIRELWLTGPQNTVTRYACSSGEYMFDDQDLRNSEVYCPIGFARFMNNGTFHGAGLFDFMFSIHRHMEMLQKSLFNNIRDIDRYGVLVLPQGTMNQNNILREVGRGLRTMFWEPDAVSEGFSPFSIQPHNSGDVPGRVAQFASEAMQRVNPIQDLMKEKGRVDSASGLQFLDEQISRALTNPTNGVQSAYSDMYRSVLQKATQQLTVSPRAIPVNNLTIDLAGVAIDPKNMEVTFARNPLPRISGLRFTIRDLSPRSVVARKQEAIQLWQMKIETDPMAFRLFALKEALDFAMWSDEDKGAYEVGVLTVLMLYGDGEENNQVVLTPHTTRPELMLRVVNAFSNSPYMAFASDQIINDFAQLRETLMSYMGLTLPNAVPNPDDAAMLMQGSGGASGMQPPPPM